MKFKDILNGPEKVTGKKEKNKKNRKEKIKLFKNKYGSGDEGLSDNQKKNRIEKYINNIGELEKLKGFGKDKTKGVDIINNSKEIRTVLRDIKTEEDYKIVCQNRKNEIIENLKKYPIDKRVLDKEGRLLNIKVKDDGSMIIKTLLVNGKEKNPLTRSWTTCYVMSDKKSAFSEIKQYKEGKLREVSDRTMSIHEKEEVLDILLDDDSVDTDEDKEFQI